MMKRGKPLLLPLTLASMALAVIFSTSQALPFLSSCLTCSSFPFLFPRLTLAPTASCEHQIGEFLPTLVKAFVAYKSLHPPFTPFIQHSSLQLPLPLPARRTCFMPSPPGHASTLPPPSYPPLLKPHILPLQNIGASFLLLLPSLLPPLLILERLLLLLLLLLRLLLPHAWHGPTQVVSISNRNSRTRTSP